jgi:hypothetical protein
MTATAANRVSAERDGLSARTQRFSAQGVILPIALRSWVDECAGAPPR